ncbi:ABC transporter ATP-binding protein [Salsipaludibacter albus]|uniref:ABC transporter ATP-binding protein n=1 Tax=Salsipaludibacter albus TaxID=2849650 RepID=UPI001EE4A838|nr:ATP-binding cassette domain-containing protein [Salsipaludibacter albus]MBY5162405.1 ATP-binding cassette domain-containing protein [Salsipaludibacter albus]
MLRLDDLHKRYGEVRALDGLSLSASPGRILGFLGPNGAGKTTSMRSIFGLVELDRGEVRFDDEAITARRRLRFGYMPEQRGLYPRMTAERQLVFIAQLHGLTRATATEAARSWLDRLGLGDRHDDPVSSLSHGNQQRVQLAAALVHDPDLLVLDEPFSGLDPLGVAAMSDVLVRRAADGATVVFSSHQLDLVEDLVDDVVIVAHGRDRLAGTLDEVRSSTGTRTVTFRLAEDDLPDRVVAPAAVDAGAHDADEATTVDLAGTRGWPVEPGRDGQGVLRVDTRVQPDAVMEAVRRHGRLERFSFEPPSLSEVFRDVVGMSVAEVEATHAEEQA